VEPWRTVEQFEYSEYEAKFHIYVGLFIFLLNSTIEIEQRYVKTALQVNRKFLTVSYPYRQVDLHLHTLINTFTETRNIHHILSEQKAKQSCKKSTAWFFQFRKWTLACHDTTIQWLSWAGRKSRWRRGRRHDTRFWIDIIQDQISNGDIFSHGYADWLLDDIPRDNFGTWWRR
jgi:hypothetical protein